MAACFIQSYDCEGLWGVADLVNAHSRESLSSVRLAEVYDSLLALLDQFHLPATMAWVGMFALPSSAYEGVLPLLKQLHARCPGYLDSFFSDLESGRANHWNGAACLARVQERARLLEIGFHGFSHIPWDWPGFDSSAAKLEVAGMAQVAAGCGLPFNTFVFPRNAVNHIDVLQTSRVIGYRAARQPRSRFRRLLGEFSPWPTADAHSRPSDRSGDLVPIPAGDFFSTQFGLRRIIPSKITVARWRSIIDSAIKRSGVAHLWLHPENLALASEGVSVLGEVLSYVARARDAGNLEVLTMSDYCLRANKIHK